MNGIKRCSTIAGDDDYNNDDDDDDYDDDDNDDDVAIDGDDDDIVCRICACPAVSIPRQILVISKWYLARQINVQMS